MPNERHRLPSTPARSEWDNLAEPGYDADRSGERLSITVGRAEWERPGHGEDMILQNDERHIYGVFDGAGGEGNDPKLASRLASETVNEKLSSLPAPTKPKEALAQMQEAFNQARDNITREAGDSVTTATVAKVMEMSGRQYLSIGNAGDSRMFRFNISDPRNPTFDILTTDQSIRGNTIYNWLGRDKDSVNMRDEYSLIELKPGDRIVICSDGITGDNKSQALTTEEMIDASTQPTAQASADRFLELSKKNDDKSVLVIDFNETGASSPQPSESSEPVAPDGRTGWRLPQKKSPNAAGTPGKALVKHSNASREAYRENISLADAEEEAWAMKDYIDLSARRERTVAGGFRRRSKGPKYILDDNGNKIQAHVTEGRASKKNVEAARQKFEKIRNENKRKSAEAMHAAGYNRDEYMMSSIADDTSETEFIAHDIAGTRKELAAPRYERVQKFYDWWARQGGKKLLTKGNAKKAAVVAVPGVVAGMAFRAFVPGVGVGVGAAMGMARAYGAGLAVGKIEEGSDRTVADNQARTRLEIQLRQNKKAYRDRKNTASITEAYAKATQKEVARNRKRLGKAAVIGGAAGALGVPLGRLAETGVDHLVGAFSGGSMHGVATYNGPKTHTGGNSGKGALADRLRGGSGGSQNSAPTSHHELSPNGKSFNVEHGSGEIREIQQYAASRGHNVSAEQASTIWNHAHAKFGDKVIKLSGKGPSTYNFTDANGQPDVGLTHAGTGHWWSRSVEQYVDDQINKAA